MWSRGQLHQALRAAKRAQALEPKLAAPRILRAIALHRLGKPRSAMFHLRRALDLSTDRNERITVTRLLRQIQAGLTVKMSGGFGVAPSSNINKISYSTHTHLDQPIKPAGSQTIPWTASEPQRSGSGLRLWSGLSYSPAPDATGAHSLQASTCPPISMESRASIAAR